MKAILDEIYNVINESGEVIKGNKDYNKLSVEAADIYDEFDKSMNEEQKEKLSKLWAAEAGCEYETGLAYYKAGFKAGLIVAFECFKD